MRASTTIDMYSVRHDSFSLVHEIGVVETTKHTVRIRNNTLNCRLVVGIDAPVYLLLDIPHEFILEPHVTTDVHFTISNGDMNAFASSGKLHLSDILMLNISPIQTPPVVFVDTTLPPL
jgi:hypothetical protein